MRGEIGPKMVTDDERRRVAERLRRLNAPSMIALMSILDVSGRDMCTRLADLIEPGDMSHGCRDTVACDRETLLALADDVDGAADDSGGFEPLAGMLRDISRRIREACNAVAAG